MELVNNISINAHSSIRIEGTMIMYFDPYIVEEEKHDADLIFFTHSHHDHLSPDDFRKYEKEDTLFIAPLSCKDDVEKAGIKEQNAIFMEPGDSIFINDIEIEAVHSYNIGKPMHKKEYNWLGYIVTVDEKKVYVCGDMDITPEAENVKCDILMAPCGGTYTMNAEEAAQLANTIKPSIAIPTHYGSIVGDKSCGEIFKKNVYENIEVVFKL